MSEILNESCEHNIVGTCIDCQLSAALERERVMREALEEIKEHCLNIREGVLSEIYDVTQEALSKNGGKG